jgi:hypothetical protein
VKQVFDAPPSAEPDSAVLVYATAFGLVVFALVVAVVQLKWLNLSLERFSPLLVVPVYQASLLSWSTLSSGLFFGDLLTLSAVEYVGFFSGLVLIVTGVIHLGRTTPSVTSGTVIGGGGAADKA